MPYLSYTLKNPVTDETFQEKDYFEPTEDETLTIINKVLLPLNNYRRRLGEVELSIASVEVITDAIHLHSWRRTHQNRWANQAVYVCKRCGITGVRFCSVVGEEKGAITRTKPHDKEKEELCRDPLKPLPKKLSFNFK